MPTANANISKTVNGSGRRGKLLLDATKQFCLCLNNNKQSDKDQYVKLFYSLIAHTDFATRKTISSILARHCYTPRPIAYYLAMEDAEIAAPFLLISPVLWERDLIQLIAKLNSSSLTIIARRADITRNIAKELISHGDKTVCNMLSLNGLLKPDKQMTRDLDLVLSDKGSGTQTNGASEEVRMDARNELLKLAGATGKFGRDGENSVQKQVAKTHPKIDSLPFAEQILALAELKETQKIAIAIASRIEISSDNISKLLSHENGTSLIIFLKGMNFSRSQASRLLLLVNKRVARNITEFTGSMKQFDRFSVVQCQDLMRNLGAKNVAGQNANNDDRENRVALNKASFERRQQIFARPSSPLFGTKRKAG